MISEKLLLWDYCVTKWEINGRVIACLFTLRKMYLLLLIMSLLCDVFMTWNLAGNNCNLFELINYGRHYYIKRFSCCHFSLTLHSFKFTPLSEKSWLHYWFEGCRRTKRVKRTSDKPFSLFVTGFWHTFAFIILSPSWIKK